MSKLSVTDPHTVAGVVTELGGRVINGPTLRFELPQSEVKEVIPKLNELGLRCERVGERVGDHPRQINRQCSFVTIALYKDP
jgi:hypothetical protein